MTLDKRELPCVLKCGTPDIFIKLYNALAVLGAKKHQIRDALIDDEGNSLISTYKL